MDIQGMDKVTCAPQLQYLGLRSVTNFLINRFVSAHSLTLRCVRIIAVWEDDPRLVMWSELERLAPHTIFETNLSLEEELPCAEDSLFSTDDSLLSVGDSLLTVENSLLTVENSLLSVEDRHQISQISQTKQNTRVISVDESYFDISRGAQLYE